MPGRYKEILAGSGGLTEERLSAPAREFSCGHRADQQAATQLPRQPRGGLPQKR